MRRVRSDQRKGQQLDAGLAKDRSGKERSIRKRSKWKRWLAIAGVVALGAVAAAPTILMQQRAWVVSQINKR